jgi:hypothetical protein
MGIFADKCRSLIDPKTGRALSGEALEKAQLEKKWPRCNNQVKKAAKFCNKCGSPAPKGWWKCPNCKKIVGNDSHYCWNCNAQLQPEMRVNIAGGVWNKESGVFAQRFEIGDIKQMLKKDLQIQAGTMALLLDGGKYKGLIKAGQYDPDSLLHKINHFGTPPPRTVILVDSGDVILPVRVSKLRSSEGMALEFYGEIVFRFNPKQAQDFVENRFKDSGELSYEDLSDLLRGDLRHAVDAMCTTSTIDDLIRDPERRIRLQDEVASSLQVTLARSGLDLVHISSAEFSGNEYEALLEKQGGNEQKRREIEYEAQLRNMLSQETMESFKSEQDLKEYQELLVHEYNISSQQRDREEVVLLRGWASKDELEDQQHAFLVELNKAHHAMQLDTEQVEHTILQDEKRDEYDRSKNVKRAETQAQVRDAAFQQEIKETEQALAWREKKSKMKADEKDRDIQRRQGLNELELLTDIEDSQQRRDLMELMKLKMQQGQSAEQILALAAASSPAAADALARMKASESQHDKEILEQMKVSMKESQSRQDKTIEMAMDTVKAVAKKESGNTIINK